MQNKNKIIHYSSQRQSSVFSCLNESFRELRQSHELAQRLFKRDVKAKYRQTFLGILWAIVPPLLTALLWIFLKGNRIIGIPNTNISYPLFVLTGTILWQTFTEAIRMPVSNLKSNKNLIIKLNIPRDGLILSGFYTLLFNLSIKLMFLVVIFFWFGQELTWQILLFPLGVFSIILCGFSIGVLLTPIGMIYNDVQKILNVVLPFMMYLTPIVYPPKFHGTFGWIVSLNPLTTLIGVTRNWFTGQLNENLLIFFILLFGFATLLLVALALNRISMPLIIERLGS